MPVINPPKGFKLSVTEAAIKAPGRKDLALIYAEDFATLAATYTTNKVKAAPVLMDMVRTRHGKARAVVINSGNANACTGEQGMKDAQATASELSAHLGVPEESVLVCSTGVIGVPMPMQRLKPALKPLAAGLGKADVMDLARAIMTTDTFPKIAEAKVKVGGVEGRVVGVCKGAGMIEPNMATMLCFIMTDLDVERDALKGAFNWAVESSFNRITVDGERSTNDTAMALASGAAKNDLIRIGSVAHKRLTDALFDVMWKLGRMIVEDGEGATKIVEIEVDGAANDKQALQAAKAIANSLLVKTAIYGADPNWGRIISAVGASGVSMKEERVDIRIGKVKIASGGLATGKLAAAAEQMKAKDIKIKVSLNIGSGAARVLTCDLTEKYIKINAEYTT